jgi:hypothetical protein
MHDAMPASAYCYGDDEDDLPPISIARTRTDGALTMQVLMSARLEDGSTFTGWHRRMPDLSTTACDSAIPTQFAPIRREELRGDLCPECFTRAERRRAAENNLKDEDYRP